MKITGIRSILFEHQMARPIGDANNPRGRDQYAALAVFVDTDLGLTGVSLGDLVFITETGGGVPVVGGFAEEARGVSMAAQPATSVSGGELELQMAVQAVFSIR